MVGIWDTIENGSPVNDVWMRNPLKRALRKRECGLDLNRRVQPGHGRSPDPQSRASHCSSPTGEWWGDLGFTEQPRTAPHPKVEEENWDGPL